MKLFLVVAAVVLLLLLSSTAVAGWAYVAPARGAVVYGYWPTAPVYAYPAPVMVPAPMVPMPAMVAPAPYVYPAPVIVRPRYYFGQPVRNVVRAVVP